MLKIIPGLEKKMGYQFTQTPDDNESLKKKFRRSIIVGGCGEPTLFTM
jgi:hypothetical protein